jgi:hypothetical protein
MHLPFTATQFVQVFARYNAAIGLVPLLAYALAAASVYLAIKPRVWGDRFIGLSLAGMWAFTGIAYHLMSFAVINPAAKLFGVMFIAQAAFFAITSLRGKLRFAFDLRQFRSRMGLVMVAFSTIAYPLIGMASGHAYPNGPVFGVTPCPLVIFSFGMLLLSDRSMPKYLVAIPMAWALIGATAAISLGIREDTGLLITGTLATVALLVRKSEGVRAVRKPLSAVAHHDHPAVAATRTLR